MKLSKPIFIGSFAVITAFSLVIGYDYFFGHKIITNTPLVLSATDVADTVTYTNLNGVSETRQLVKSPVEVSYSSEDKTPLIVSTGKDGNGTSFLAKFVNYALGRNEDRVLTVSNTGDLITTGSIEGDKGVFDALNTDKVSLNGTIKFKSRTSDPTKTDSGTKNKYGLLWLGNSGADLNFMDSTDAKFRIVTENSEGNVGIGTANPGSSLTIKPVLDSGLEIRESDDGNIAAQLVANTTRGTLNLYDRGTRTVEINGAAGVRSYFNTGGNVGIGTTGPELPLHVKGQGIRLENAGSTQKWGLGYFGTNDFTILDATANTSRLFIQASTGNVGIGTTNPGYALDVYRNGEDSRIRAIANGDYFPSLRLQRTGGNTKTDRIWALFVGSNGEFEIQDQSAGLNRLIIDTSGNVGIGASFPTELLDVASDTVRIRQDKTPANSTESCNKGEIIWDSGFIYVCVADNSWKRATLASF